MSALTAATAEVDLLVVGSGPHALTVLAYLQHAGYPVDDRVAVVDRSPWLHRWNASLQALDIPMLRSGCVHHPHPDPMALLEVCPDRRRMHDSIGRPETGLFAAFCSGLVGLLGLEQRRMAASVRALVPAGDGVEAQLSDGRRLRARRAILATNPSSPDLPTVAVRAAAPGQRPSRGRVGGGVLHSDHVHLDRDVRSGDQVLVVGGGLTAAQLALGALRRGAPVVVVHRSPLRVRDLDAQPSWMHRDLALLLAEPRPRARHAMIRGARTRGTIPPRELRELHEAQSRGDLVMHQAALRSVRRVSGGVEVETAVGVHRGRSLWLATGHRFPIGSAGVAGRCLQRAGTPTTRGLPHLTPDLRIPGTPIHLMGALTGLQTGPLARSLVGARIASERIAAAVAPAPPDRWQYPHPNRTMEERP